MMTLVDDALRREGRDYAFRFSCEACAHHDPDTGLCANGYPNAEHRGIDLSRAEVVVFCKGFELG
jgi:hypothetical protein